MTITLPYPPSSNRYWRMWRGRMVVSTEGRAYRQAVQWRCVVAGLTKPLASPVALTLRVYRPRRKGDLGNRLKILEDALQGHAYSDDEQVTEIHMWRSEDKANPRVEVEVVPA